MTPQSPPTSPMTKGSAMISETQVHEVVKITVERRSHATSQFPFHCVTITGHDKDGNHAGVVFFSSKPIEFEVVE